MSEHYNIPAQDFFVPGEWTGALTDEERREMTLRNLAMSKASKAKRKKKKQPAKPSERKLTDPEIRAKEQERIRKERAERGALSEANRREAGIGQPAPAAESEPLPEPPKPQEPKEKEPKEKEPERKPEQKPKPEPTPTDISKIEIDVPTEPEPPKPEPEPPKKEKKSKRKNKPEKKAKPETKQKQKNTNTGSRQERAARQNRSSAARRYTSRITTSGAVTLGLLTGLLIGTVIYGRVQTNEIYTVINAKQAEYDDLVAKNVSMKSEMEGKMTVKNIEEYAENELGLMPLDQSQIVYLQLQTEDEVNITEPEDNLFVTVNDYLVGIWEYLRGK